MFERETKKQVRKWTRDEVENNQKKVTNTHKPGFKPRGDNRAYYIHVNTLYTPRSCTVIRAFFVKNFS